MLFLPTTRKWECVINSFTLEKGYSSEIMLYFKRKVLQSLPELSEDLDLWEKDDFSASSER